MWFWVAEETGRWYPGEWTRRHSMRVFLDLPKLHVYECDKETRAYIHYSLIEGVS